MTINLLFVSLTINRRKQTLEQVHHEEQVFKSYEALQNKCFQMYHGN
jgi:uncharacterized protein (TIGR02413 family)